MNSRGDASRRRLIAVLRDHPGITIAEAARATGLHPVTVSERLMEMAGEKIARFEVLNLPGAPRAFWLYSDRARLSVMIAGEGDRRDDCARYAACLDAFVRTSKATAARCPDGCSRFEARNLAADLDEIGGSRGGAGSIT